MAATKREQITNFLNKNGFSSLFQGDQFEQVVNAVELYTSKKENRKKKNKMSAEEVDLVYNCSLEVNNTFPNKLKIPTSGLMARSPLKEVVDAISWFRGNYEYDWKTIVAATVAYVSEFSVSDYNYMRTSKYFIRKQLQDKTWGSTLANYCEQIKGGIKGPAETPYITNKVV